MGQENLDEFGAALAGEDRLESYLEQARTGILGASRDEFAAELGDLLSDADRRVMSGDFASFLSATMQEAVENGIWGWLDDDIAFIRAWGFDLAAITTPVTVWQGAQDRFVPFAHGRWLAENVSGARGELPADEGHLSIAIGAYGRLLDGLLAAAG
jgi:pimeloyl-ACP methyl ester carboxylesterase